jgi:hypothetical protein
MYVFYLFIPFDFGWGVWIMLVFRKPFLWIGFVCFGFMLEGFYYYEPLWSDLMCVKSVFRPFRDPFLDGREAFGLAHSAGVTKSSCVLFFYDKHFLEF